MPCRQRGCIVDAQRNIAEPALADDRCQITWSRIASAIGHRSQCHGHPRWRGLTIHIQAHIDVVPARTLVTGCQRYHGGGGSSGDRNIVAGIGDGLGDRGGQLGWSLSSSDTHRHQLLGDVQGKRAVGRRRGRHGNGAGRLHTGRVVRVGQHEQVERRIFLAIGCRHLGEHGTGTGLVLGISDTGDTSHLASSGRAGRQFLAHQQNSRQIAGKTGLAPVDFDVCAGITQCGWHFIEGNAHSLSPVWTTWSNGGGSGK